MQPAFMRPQSAKLQYILLAIVAMVSLLHAFGGAMGDFGNLMHGASMSQFPFGVRNAEPVVTTLTASAVRGGLAKGDVVLSVNGTPLTGFVAYLDEVRRTRPTQVFTVAYVRPPAGVAHPGRDSGEIRTTRIAAVGYERKSIWAATLAVVYFALPFFCLLIGLYVVFARPRSDHAWLILGVLAYCDAVFFPMMFMPRPLILLSTIWSSLVQTEMPIALMLFAISFPDRSTVDRKIPWFKWVLLVPLIALYPLDLFWEIGSLYRYSSFGSLLRIYPVLSLVEIILNMVAISYFFFCLVTRIQTSTGDARRRLRVLYAGSTIGLSPFFVLVVVSLVRGTEFGEGVPRWIFLPCVMALLLFPLSLAYVVVVQRAMDLRILIRQGTKYFFARHTLTVVRVLLAVWISVELKHFFSGAAHQRMVDIVRILGIIGLFMAFRFVLSKRLQEKIDQRFFREAYSSEQVLSELSEEARNFVETRPLLETITQRIGATLHIDRVAVFLRSGDIFQLQYATGMAVLPGAQALYLPSSSATISTLSLAKSPEAVYRDDSSSWLVDASDAERMALQDLSTELLVPLPGRNRLIGVMALGPKRSEEPYSRADRQLLQTVASQTGLALENAELLETLTSEIAARERVSREIEIAREVQERLFPQSYPAIDGLDMAGFCRPAHAVGGDYYDLFSLGSGATDGEERLAVAVGDISGKGISASLLMASLRASLRSLARVQRSNGTPDLAGMIRHVNNLVYEASAANRYATFFFAELDLLSRQLTYVNAGHNPPVILRCGQTISLEATGMVVGLLPDAEYTQAQIGVEEGDVLLAFTDGISEAMTVEEEEWGEDRMIAAAHALLRDPACTYTAEQMLRCLMEQADRFTEGAAQHDDMTLLICRVLR